MNEADPQVAELRQIQKAWERKAPPNYQAPTGSEDDWHYLRHSQELRLEKESRAGLITAEDVQRRLTHFDNLASVELRKTEKRYGGQSGEDLWSLDGLLQSYADQLAAAAGRMGVGKDNRLTVGCILDGRVNAVSRPSKTDPNGAITLFDIGMPLGVNLLSKAVGLCYPAFINERGNRVYVTDKDKIRERILANHPLTTRLYGEFLNAYIIEGNPGVAGSQVVPDTHVPIVDTLRDSAELFAVAHEYAHLLNGDLNRLPSWTSDVHWFDQFLMLFQTHNQELAADKKAALLTVAAGPAYSLPPVRALLGAVMWFYMLEILYIGIYGLAYGSISEGRRALQLKGGEWAEFTEHPSPKERVEVLKEATPTLLWGFATGATVYAETAYEENIAAIQYIMEMLNGFALHALEVAIEKGLKPNQKWGVELAAGRM